MKTKIQLLFALFTLAFTCTGIAVADRDGHKDKPAVTPTVSGTPALPGTPTATPTPKPVCPAADLITYSTCVATCDAASSAVCTNQGSADHYIAFLKSSLGNCSYPNLNTEKQFNGLKDVVNGLKQSGSLSGQDAFLLRKQINTCRKASSKGKGHKHNEDH